jgi:hypothetical protein
MRILSYILVPLSIYFPWGDTKFPLFTWDAHTMPFLPYTPPNHLMSDSIPLLLIMQNTYKPLIIGKGMADIIVNRKSFKLLPRMTRDFMKRATEEINIITRSFTWADDETLEVMYALINKGVRIKIVGKFGEESKDIIRKLIKLGAIVKLHEFAGEARFMIIDEKEVVFAIREPLTPTERHYVGIMIKDESTAKTVKQYIFNGIFKEAEEADYVVS